jgi:hypothetical protein
MTMLKLGQNGPSYLAEARTSCKCNELATPEEAGILL